MSYLAKQIHELLDEELKSKEIAARLQCSESYIRSVRCGFRGKVLKSSKERNDTKYEPITPAYAERIARLYRAGLSIWEVQQLLPHAAARIA